MANKNAVEMVLNLVNQTLIGQGIGLGSYLGIFDAMSMLEKPETCVKIAESGKWKPRYMEEWLNLMVCGRIVEYNAEEKTYYLPEAMRPVLSTYGKSKNLGVLSELLNVVGIPIHDVAACFAIEGPIGVPYSSFIGFREWRKKFLDVTIEWQYLNRVYELIPGLVGKLDAGIEVCDGGCNSGNHIIITAEHYPKSTFIGFDISEEPLNIARDTCKTKALNNIKFELQDGCKMPSDWTNKFDFFTATDVIHDIPFAKLFLKEVLRVLKPGGIFLMADVNMHTDVQDNIGHHLGGFFYGASLFHCMTVSLSTAGSEGLGTCWGIEKQRQYLTEAGFKNMSQLDVQDPTNTYFVGYKQE